jgi:hypothetical protein
MINSYLKMRMLGNLVIADLWEEQDTHFLKPWCKRNGRLMGGWVGVDSSLVRLKQNIRSSK